MPRSWRIVKTRFAEAAFDGEGARRHGGRWTGPGLPVVYTAEHISLALLEVLVHLRDGRFLPSYSLCGTRFPEELIQRLETTELPDDWRRFPGPPDLQILGDRWLRSGATAVLEVPSAIVPRERNYLLNPAHPDFAEISLEPPEPFTWDQRLLDGSFERAGTSTRSGAGAELEREEAERKRRSAFEIYRRFDLGPGGYARRPATESRRGARKAILRKHRR